MTAPFSENFDGTGWKTFGGHRLDNCWQRPDDGQGIFKFRPAFTSSYQFAGPATDHTTGSGKFLMAEVDPLFAFSDDGEAVLVSPPFDLSPLDTPEVSFWYHAFGFGGKLELEIFDGLQWKQEFEWNGGAQNSPNETWCKVVIPMENYRDDTVIFRWTCQRSSLFFSPNLGLDDFEIYKKPDCPAPLNPTAFQVGPYSAGLFWEANQGSDWQVEYWANQFVPITKNYLTLSNGTLYLTGLQPGTPYRFRLRDSCGSAGFSAWAGDTFRTAECPNIVAGFTYNVNQGQQVQFQSNPSQNQDSVFWDFGDGNASSQPNPLHIYSQIGTYLVSLRAYHQCGKGDTLMQKIKICGPLMADFNYLQQADTVHFDASAAQTASYWVWDFGGWQHRQRAKGKPPF